MPQTRNANTILIITVSIVMSSLLIFAVSDKVNAADIKFRPQVSLGPFTRGAETGIDPSTIGTYINAIYKYAISIVAIFATVMMMWGGLMWITAAGNAGRVDNAKSYVTSALTGLVLALASYMVLYTINPDLTRFASINPTKGGKAVMCCDMATEKLSQPETGVDKKTNTITYDCKGLPECSAGQVCTKDGCLDQAEYAKKMLTGCCITNNGGNITYKETTKNDCSIPLTQTWSQGKACPAAPATAAGCVPGEQCGTNRICVDNGGTLSCEPCSPLGGTCGGSVGCCQYLALTCQLGPNLCIAAPTIDCTNPANDGRSCGTEKVCSGGSCKNCEIDEGDWCTATPCCENLTCCPISWSPDQCHATCP